ncbi:MAG: LysM peptidoglycan-binding domain-containing protein [Duncaniella sp.]|nr:LysM peptidoglycan-binding domain-containing protein [Duncaniella sp.]
MNFSRFAAITALAGLSSMMSLQAAVKDLPIKNVNGRMYHYYEVPAKETVYSLCYKLNVTKEDLIKNNPAVADGLRAGMTLFFPVDGDNAATSTQPAHRRSISYEVQKGETIFGIAQKHGVRTEDIIAWNPVLKNGLKAGQTIRIEVADDTSDSSTAVADHTVAPVEQPTVVEQRMEGYIVKKKETFYSIARAHNMSVADLEAANPGITSLRAGQVLNIPVNVSVTAGEVADNVASTEPAEVASGNDAVNTEPVDLSGVSVASTERPVSVAVMLPFMLKEDNMSKNAARYTEFYKGFLLAVDSLRASGAPIHVTAYDTEGSVIKVREAITDPAFRNHTAIIAPDNAAQLAVLAEYGRNNNVKVFNTFIVRDDSYETNPAVMQGNLPSSLMYRKAIDALMVRLDYSTPVIVSVKDSQNDKADFITALRSALDAAGKTHIDIEVDGSLTPADLSALNAGGNYMFIPTSSRQADLNKLMPGIIEWRDQTGSSMVRMFGYPEWTTFRGETLANMHNLNTTVYSRFFTDEGGARVRDIDTRYKKWYGTQMENAVPRQGLLGFDTGMYVLLSLTGHPEGYDGVQNGYYYITPSQDGGAYNDALYFINYRPGNIIDKSRI